jgi:hypothetical protein
MVVDYLNIVGVAFAPYEANSPLIVDPDAVLAKTTALEALKPIAWYGRENCQVDRGVEHLQLPEQDALNRLKLRRAQTVEEPLSLGAAEAANH